MHTVRMIPATLFDDIYDHPEHLGEICVCFLSIDAAIPTSAARLHLEYSAELGKLTRIDLKQFGAANPAWASAVLNSHDKLRQLLEFPGDMHLYADPERAFDPALRDRLARRLLEISSMLDIRERLLEREGQRLGWLFHTAARVMRSPNDPRHGLRCPEEALRVVGRIARLGVSPRTKSYLGSFVEGSSRFESLRVSRATQLRLLWHLGLGMFDPPLSDRYASGDLEPSSAVRRSQRCFHDCSPGERADMVERLCALFRRLSSEDDEPRDVALDDAATGDATTGGDAAPRSELYGGEADWFAWVKKRVPQSAEEKQLREAFLVRALASLNPEQYEANRVESLTRDLIPKRVDEVFVNRLACSRVVSRAL